MKALIIPVLAAAVAFGCTAEKKPVAPVKQSSAAVQRANAEAAQQEMDEDIKSGVPTLREPVIAAPQAVIRPKEEPKMTLPERTVSSVSSLKPVSKYPMKNGYPEWFYTPVYDGYIGAVGIAKKQPSGGMAAQKRVARMMAQKELAKQVEVLVTSELTLETLNVDRTTVKYYREKLTSLTKENTDQFLTDFKVQDEWLDERTGEYYLWMVLSK